MTRNREEGTLLLSQPTYTRKLRSYSMLADYGMQDANACRAPMDSKLQLQAAAREMKPAQLSHMLRWSAA
jgi:hypothetical protein